MRNCLILIFMFCVFSAAGQKIPDYGLNKVRITAGDKVIQAELKPVNSDPNVETDRFYYWYSSNIVHVTQGGFSGRLLNGKYTEYYLNKNIKEEGVFDKGLKKSAWKNWNDMGILLQFYSWKKGMKDGKFSLFDDYGNLKQNGHYHHNLLNGKVTTYAENGSTTIVNYKNGVIITKNPSKFWQKFNLFKWIKKHKSAGQDNKTNQPQSK